MEQFKKTLKIISANYLENLNWNNNYFYQSKDLSIEKFVDLNNELLRKYFHYSKKEWKEFIKYFNNL